jgi:hypothetical protein
MSESPNDEYHLTTQTSRPNLDASDEMNGGEGGGETAVSPQPQPTWTQTPHVVDRSSCGVEQIANL